LVWALQKEAYAALQYSRKGISLISRFQISIAFHFKLARHGHGNHGRRIADASGCRQKEQNLPMTKESAMAKYYTSEVAVKTATEAVQIFGGYGYTKDFPVEKFYRDSKLCTIGEGTSEIQKIVIAREVLY
jgi:alkylation response protein AidB-like acyl-CoA dehydrogenase